MLGGLSNNKLIASSRVGMPLSGQHRDNSMRGQTNGHSFTGSRHGAKSAGCCKQRKSSLSLQTNFFSQDFMSLLSLAKCSDMNWTCVWSILQSSHPGEQHFGHQHVDEESQETPLLAGTALWSFNGTAVESFLHACLLSMLFCRYVCDKCYI